MVIVDVIRTENGISWVEREPTKAEIEEMAAHQNSEEMPPPEPTPEERIAALEEQNEMLTECILELSELLYN